MAKKTKKKPARAKPRKRRAAPRRREAPPALATAAGVPPPLSGVPPDQVGATVQRFIDFDGVRSIRADDETGGLTFTVTPLA